jgi:hypothetical protein
MRERSEERAHHKSRNSPYPLFFKEGARIPIQKPLLWEERFFL